MGRKIPGYRFPERDPIRRTVLLTRGVLACFDRIQASLELLAALLCNLAGRSETDIRTCAEPHVARAGVPSETENPSLRATVRDTQVEATAIGIEPLLFQVFDSDCCQTICRLCHLRCGFSPCFSPCSKARF